jgi:hypothetical protein
MKEIESKTEAVQLKCPVNFCNRPVICIVKEAELGDGHILMMDGGPLDCQSEYYSHYASGLLVKRDISTVNFMARAGDL